MKCMRIFPEMCARTLWPLSSWTRNIAFGRGSITVPSTSIASSFGNENLSKNEPHARHLEARPDNTNPHTAQVHNTGRDEGDNARRALAYFPFGSPAGGFKRR